MPVPDFEPVPMFGHGPLPLALELAFGVCAGIVGVAGVVGADAAGVVVLDGEVLVAADAPVIPAAAPAVARAPATSVAPTIFEMCIFAPFLCLGGGGRVTIMRELANSRLGPGVGVA